VFVALAISLLGGPSTLFSVFVNTLFFSVPPTLILGFVRGTGMSDKAFAVSGLTLAAIPIVVTLMPSTDLWFVYLLLMPGAFVGAIAALRYDRHLRERNRSPRSGWLILCILGGALLGNAAIAVLWRLF